MTTVVIFGSGDPGTCDVLQAYILRDVAVEFRDIRVARGGRDNLVDVMNSGVTRIPMTYLSDGESITGLIGGYDAAMAHAETLPALQSGAELPVTG